MNEELNRALDQISDEHIREAACHRKSRRAWWIGSIAAALAMVICWCAVWGELGAFSDPTQPTIVGSNTDPTSDPSRPTISGTEPPVLQPGHPQDPGMLQLTNLVASPAYPKMPICPVYDEYTNKTEYYNDLSTWQRERRLHYQQFSASTGNLADFFQRSIQEFLSGDENRAYSPMNLYLGLAMLAETADGDSRQQILDLLGADSIDELRAQAAAIWNMLYCDDGQTTSLLANSLWLDEAYQFKDNTIQTLADSYYASVFHGDLGTDEMNEQLRTWIDSQTGGLLEQYTKKLTLSEDSVFALASTVYFKAGWDGGFSKKNTTEGVFHCKDHDLTTQFMNKTITEGIYYWGEDFSAVRLALDGGNAMWLILPDEDKTMEDVLASGEYLDMTRNPAAWENRKKIKINLSMPKFDVSSKADLIDGMKRLGVTDVFDFSHSDFTPITDTDELAVTKVEQAVRVAIDEEGVVAAAYIVMDIECGMVPSFPDDEIDFTLDRPFLFLVSGRGTLPLFTGVVEQP